MSTGISIHSLVKRETSSPWRMFLLPDDFNPLPRKEGDSPDVPDFAGVRISIHSLVKRETWAIRCFFISKNNFNPLPRKEGDCGNCFHLQSSESISIHSLVKRETSDCLCKGYTERNFNPLPRKEGDRTGKHIVRTIYNFNPLPRKEGDIHNYKVDVRAAISIHSLVKRETDCVPFPVSA